MPLKARVTSATLTLLFMLLSSVSVFADDGPDIEQLSAAGTFLTSRLDANADGEAASWCTLQIRGGYQGATGTYGWEYSGQLQYFDPAAVPPQQFGSLTGTGTWEINRSY